MVLRWLGLSSETLYQKKKKLGQERWLSIKSTCVTPVLEYLIPSSGLCRHRAYTWCQTYIQLKYSDTIIIIKYTTLNAVWTKTAINSEPLFNQIGQDKNEGLECILTCC